MSHDKKKTPQENVESPFPASFLPSLFPSTLGQGSDLGSIERTLRSRVLEESARTLEASLNEEILRHPAPMVCLRCGGALKDKGIKPKEILTLFGSITVRRRYGYCPRCKKGDFPDDRRLGLDGSGLSPEVKRLSGLFGGETDFARGRTFSGKPPGSVCRPGSSSGRRSPWGKRLPGARRRRSRPIIVRCHTDGPSTSAWTGRGFRCSRARPEVVGESRPMAPPRRGKRRCATSGRPTT